MERHQLADADANGDTYATFNYSDESATALRLSDRTELFPEPRPGARALLRTNLEGISFNHFSLWQIEQDGTGEETLNHLGRHETRPYFNRS